MNICFSYVEEYACVVTCVPYYINCIVSENVNFKNIYISSEICSKHTDSIYRIYIWNILYLDNDFFIFCEVQDKPIFSVFSWFQPTLPMQMLTSNSNPFLCAADLFEDTHAVR